MGSVEYLQKSGSPRVVLAHGVFDLLHLGHIRHLEQAKAMGDKLVVSITSDKNVNKGLGRPHFNEIQRLEAIQALKCVDSAFINHDPTPLGAISSLKPAIYVKGVDYNDPNHPGYIADKEFCEAAGVEFRLTTTEKWSSSRLINAEKFSPEVNDRLTDAREAKMLSRILKAFDEADKLKISFVGELIIDEYRYVRSLGKTSKEFLVATVFEGEEKFYGGAHAASLHGEWKNTNLVEGREIVKTRYVDADFNRKLFEVYDRTEIESYAPIRRGFQHRLDEAIGNSDVIVCLDFGHGLMGTAERKMVQVARFLALNSQSNAGNYGFNPVTLYERADYVCIDAPEARLATGMPHHPLQEVISALASKIECQRFLITHGRNGSYYQGETNGYAPALATGGIDTMGAGDAVLAVTAPLVAAGLDLGAAAFVGNVVGAIKISIVGHRRHVNRQEIITTLESLLK